jgi:tetratricopeptide (TPR) repeat protein
VKNETGQNSLDDITELIRAGLAQSVQISLLDQGTVGDKLQQMTKPPDAIIDEPIAREIALRSGAARVVFPTITGSNGNYNLTVEIQQPDVAGIMRNRRSSLKRFSWHTSPSSSDQTAIPESLLTAVREASDWIRLDVGESQHDIARLGSAPEDVTTSSWPALEDFSDAEKLVTQHKGEEAIALLRSAIAHDPKFALAHALLGDVLYTLGRQSEGNVSYRTALETGSEDRLSLRERDRLKGLVCQDTWDFEAAASAYREYTVYYPHDYLGWFRLARPLLMLGRTQESIEALEQAHKVDPARPGAAVQLVRGYLVLGNLPEAHRWLEILRKNFSRDNYLFALGPTQFVEGDYKAAAQTFQAFSESSDRGFQETGHILLGNLAAEEGDDQEGIRFLTLAMSNDHDNAAEQLGRAALYCKLHKYDLCIDDLNSALRAEPSPDSLVVASGILGRAISASPRANTSHLRFYLESLHKSNTAEGFGLVAELARQLLSGETVLSGGNAVAAIQAFRKADKLDAPLNSHEYLARALLASATKHPNTSTAASELREAASIYAAVALHPARIWWFSPGYPPGAFADQLESYVEVLPSASSSSATEHTLLTLSRLRHRADSNVISRRPRQVSTHTPLQPVARGR